MGFEELLSPAFSGTKGSGFRRKKSHLLRQLGKIVFMKIITDQITIEELKEMAKKMFGNLVKAVVDVEKEIMAVDGELHSDEQELLIENGSEYEDLWGIDIYPEMTDENWIEFDSLINLKPALNQRTRGVENPEIREKIIKIVNKLVEK